MLLASLAALAIVARALYTTEKAAKQSKTGAKTLVEEITERLADNSLSLVVQSACGLIKHYGFRSGGKCTRNQQTLPLTAG